MLIFCMNLCRWSLSKDTKLLNESTFSVNQCSENKKFETWSQEKKYHFVCLAFRISLNCDRFCIAGHISSQSVRTSAGTNSSSAICNCIQSSFRFWPPTLFLSCLVEGGALKCFLFEWNLAKTWYVNNCSVIQRKYNLWKCKYLWNICVFSLNNHALGERSALFWYENWYCWHLLVDNAAQCNLKTNKNPLY